MSGPSTAQLRTAILHALHAHHRLGIEAVSRDQIGAGVACYFAGDRIDWQTSDALQGTITDQLAELMQARPPWKGEPRDPFVVADGAGYRLTGAGIHRAGSFPAVV